MSSSPSLPETSNWLDGPRLVAWLRRHGLEAHEHRLSKVQAQRFLRWERGNNANVYIVDEVLIELGRHLSELPDSLFLTSQSRKGGMPPEKHERLLQGVLSGMPLKAIAREVGCAVSTVRYHKNRLQPAA